MTFRGRLKSQDELAAQLATFERLAGFRPPAGSASGVNPGGPDRPRLMQEYARVLHHARMHPERSLPQDRVTALQRLRDVVELGERLATRLQDGTIVAAGEKARPLQVKALEALSRYCQSALGDTPGQDGLLRTHFAVATGIGKTGLICMIAQAAEMPTLALVPFKTLVRQTERDAKRFAPDLKVGVFYGDEKRIPDGCGLIVSTYESAARLLNELPPGMKLPVIFYDEAHLGLTEHRLGLSELVPGAALVVGCTGSPVVNELKQVGNHFGSPLLEISTAEGIRQGQLSTTHAVTLKTNISVSGTYINADGETELTPEQREKLVQVETRNQAVINLLGAPEIKGRGTIVTCMDTDHANLLAKKAEEAGLGPVGILHYKADVDEEQLLADCRAGKIKTLFVVRKTVGVDLPNFEVLINARPTWSLTDATQRTGRVVRLCDSIPDKVALVIDLVDDYTLVEKPITAIAILEGAVILPEGAEERPGTRERIEEIQKLAISVSLPPGFKLVLSQDQQLEIISGDKEIRPARFTRGLTSLDDVKRVLAGLGINSAKDFYDRGVTALLKSRVESKDPPYSGSIRALVSGVVQHLCKRPDLAFRQNGYRFLLDVLYGDEAWAAMRNASPDFAEGGVALRLLEKLACVPPTAASSRLKVTGITRSPELDGWEQLRLLGLSRSEVEQLDLSAVVPRQVLEKLCDSVEGELRDQRAQLLEVRKTSALIQELRRIGTLPTVLMDAEPVLERLTPEEFRRRTFTDSESGHSFTGADVTRCFDLKDSGRYDSFIEAMVVDPRRVALGEAFRSLANTEKQAPRRTVEALRLLAADGLLLQRLRDLRLRPDMEPHEVATRFLQDPANVPIAALQVTDCLVGKDFAGDDQARLRWVCSALDGVRDGSLEAKEVEAAFLRNVASWGSRVYTFRELGRSEVHQPVRIILPDEALTQLRGARAGLTFGSEWQEIQSRLAIVREWQRQTGNFLTDQDRQALASTAEALVPFVGGYNPGWWRIAEGIGELVGQPVKRESMVAASISCEIRREPCALPTYDLLARPAGAREPVLSGRLTVLGESGGRPWILVESSHRASQDETLVLPPDLIADALPNMLKVAFPGREVVSPVLITRQSGGPVHSRLRTLPATTIIPMTGLSSALATAEAHVEGPQPTTIPALPEPFAGVAAEALRGADLRQRFETKVDAYLAKPIPEFLKRLLLDERHHLNLCTEGASVYVERMERAIAVGTASEVVLALGSSPRHQAMNSTLRLVVERLQELSQAGSSALTDSQVEAIAKLSLDRDRRLASRRTDVEPTRQRLETILGLAPAPPSAPNDATAAPQPAPVSLQPPVASFAVTPRDKLPTSGPLFNAQGKLLLFVSEAAPTFHSNPACKSLTDENRSALVGKRAIEVLASSPRSACCKSCGPPDQSWQVQKWETSWAKAIAQRVVKEGRWMSSERAE